MPDSGTQCEETSNQLAPRKTRTEKKVNELFFEIGETKSSRSSHVSWFLPRRICAQSNKLTRCMLVQLPPFSVFSMNINNGCAAVQLQQCTRGQHHGTSCGQVVETYTTLPQQTSLQQQQQQRTSRLSYVRTIRFDLLCTSTAEQAFIAYIQQGRDCIILESRSLLVETICFSDQITSAL